MTTIPMPPRAVALRPLALPAEHGGWGFVLEPIALGLLVAPSWSGVLIAVASLCTFLARQPLKLALQDLVRARRYPRTRVCWQLAFGYLLAGALALTAALTLSHLRMLIPLGLVMPLALTQVLHDAHGRGRELFPELCGATAMTSIAAAIALAGGVRLVPALTLSAILIARTLPAILYVRAVLGKMPAWPAIALHFVALAAGLLSRWVALTMLVLLARALWGLTHPRPPAKTVGWREIAFGAMTVLGSAGVLAG